MKMIIKKICISLFCVLFIIGFVVSCCATEISGKITVLLEDSKKNFINGMTVNICKIADMDSSGYYPTDDFITSGISILAIVSSPSESAAKDVAQYITENKIKLKSATSSKGKATFDDLELGIWLVFCDDNGKSNFNPYFVFLPYEVGGKLYYEVNSTPKTDESKPNRCNIYVVKKWEDKNNAEKKRPGFITVELFDDNQVISSAVLNEQNGWAYTFKNVLKYGNYSVKEKPVEYYEAQYDGDFQNGFVITNSYNGEKLPQTGQLWWPIFILSIAGIAFVMLGIIELGAQKNGKKDK